MACSARFVRACRTWVASARSRSCPYRSSSGVSWVWPRLQEKKTGEKKVASRQVANKGNTAWAWEKPAWGFGLAIVTDHAPTHISLQNSTTAAFQKLPDSHVSAPVCVESPRHLPRRNTWSTHAKSANSSQSRYTSTNELSTLPRGPFSTAASAAAAAGVNNSAICFSKPKCKRNTELE